MIKKRIIIKGGKVHDVGYRLHLLQKAEELLIPNIGAWSLHDNGKEIVRVLVGGDEEKVKEFLHFVRESFPEEANVEGTPTVEDYEGDIPGIEAFSRSFSTSQLTKIAKVGVGMLKKQDQTIEKLDSFHKDTIQRFDKLDNSFTSFHHDTIQRFDNLDRRYGKIAENMEKILEEMKEERKEFRKFTERIISMLLSEKSKSKDLLRKS